MTKGAFGVARALVRSALFVLSDQLKRLIEQHAEVVYFCAPELMPNGFAERLSPAAANAPFAATVVEDAPGVYHNKGSGFNFADGHSELHYWKTPAVQTITNIQLSVGANNVDLMWLQQATWTAD